MIHHTQITNSNFQLRTERLVLRHWTQKDLQPFAEINADREVMQYFPETLTREQSSAFIERIEASFAAEGLGLWATTLVGTGEFIGFVGLSRPRFSAHFTPCVEIAWRLARQHWGNGYAVEAALAALKDGFERLNLSEIVSFTAQVNKKSIRVMQKLGMHTSPEDDFRHPMLQDGDVLKPHVLYRLSANQFAHCHGR